MSAVKQENVGSSDSTSGDAITVNARLFWSRVNRLYDQWKRGGKSWGSSGNAGSSIADALVLISGKVDDEEDYTKSRAMQLMLLGVQADDTSYIFTRDSIFIFTGPKKASMLNSLTANAPVKNELKLQILPYNKTDNNAENIDTIINAIKKSSDGRKIGTLGTSFDDYLSGGKATKTSKLLATALNKNNFEAVDVTSGISIWLSIKDETAIDLIKKAATHTTNVVKRFLVNQIEDILDKGIEKKHSDLAEATEDVMKQPEKVKSNDLSPDDIDPCYTPVIQSGWGEFSLKASAPSPETPINVEGGVIIIQVGTRYKDWSSNLGRTYFVNPTEDMKRMYGLVGEIFIECKKALKAGNRANQVYEAAVKIIKQRHPQLLPSFTKSCGYGIGIEFPEPLTALTEKNQRVLQKNMVFNLVLGFDKLLTKVRDKETGAETERQYAVLLSDTVQVTENEGQTLTHAVRDWSEVAYYLDDEEERDEKEQEQFAAGPTTRRERQRQENATDVDHDAEDARKKHQADLAIRQREEALRKLAKDNVSGHFDKEENRSGQVRTISYRDVKDYPTTLKPHSITVDVPAETVFLPIADQLVPFHISHIKNVYKAENAGFTYLSIQFHVPDISSKQKSSKCVRELTFRGKMNGSLDRAFFEVKELRKRVQERLKEYEATKDIVVQEELKTTKIGTVLTLKDVACRPQLSKKKNMTGQLTAHQNGFRFVTFDKVKVDIIYSNIKHAFYQPADRTQSVILHFELRHPIMLDPNAKTKKTHYLQFYVDVVEASEDISSTSRRGDYDGLDEERRERELRKRHNERFLNFVKSVEDQVLKSKELQANNVHLEFDIPYTELSFQGVPNKQVVTMLPTVHALVALDDAPPVVIPLSEVEIASLERVSFGLRDFDMVIVWKDFDREPKRIDNIPTNHLKEIKDWLNSCDILYYELPMALVWKNIMKNINDDVEGFWKEGGFDAFLNMEIEAAAEGEEGEEGDEELAEGEENGAAKPKRKKHADEDSEFEMDSDDDSEEDEDEFDSDDSEVSEDDSDASSSDEAEGEDWDELDKKAEAADKKKAAIRRAKGERDDDDDDDDRPRKPAKSSMAVKKR